MKINKTMLATFLVVAALVSLSTTPVFADSQSQKKEVSFYLYQKQIKGNTVFDKMKNFLVTKNMILKHAHNRSYDKRFLKYHVNVENILTGQNDTVRIVFPSK